MSLEGELTRLRALEAEDVDLLYVWENDPAVWGVSGTLAPFSRHTLRRFLDEQRFDLYAARQVLGLHQLWCSVAPDNAASLALFRRAGFVECGRKREWRRTPDGWADELLLQKIF